MTETTEAPKSDEQSEEQKRADQKRRESEGKTFRQKGTEVRK